METKGNIIIHWTSLGVLSGSFFIKNVDSQLFLPSARSGQEVYENQGPEFVRTLRYAWIFAIYFRHFLPVTIINRSKAMAAGRNRCLGLDSSMTVIS